MLRFVGMLIFLILSPFLLIFVIVNLHLLIQLPLFIGRLAIAVITIAVTPFWIYVFVGEAWRWMRGRYTGEPYKSVIFARQPRPTHDFEGTRQWAEAHASYLQRLVGTVEGDMLIEAFEVRRYGWRSWGVVKLWRYVSDPDLGVFGGKFEFLPLRAPSGKRQD
jgi:hypothetical protein